MIDLSAALATYFPEHAGFLPGQREALAGVLAGRDVVAVLPTGGGKTLVYQLAGALLDGTTVVATPLLALMHDQVRRLIAAPGGNAVARRVGSLSGSVTGAERRDLLDDLGAGRLDFLFATPEQLARDDVRAALRRAPVDLFAVDEAHCISEWGYDFRPAYRELASACRAMGRPPVLALTATAPEAVRRDVAAELRLDDPVLVARGFDRGSLHFGVVRVTDPERRDRQLAQVLAALGPEEPVVVYCTTRREAEDTAQALREQGLRARHYHGGMERRLRAEVQNAFLGSTITVLCATSAFGMGIDKPDIRAVLHRTMPDSLESYWQEAGRAGRDGEPADCVLLYGPGDRGVHDHLHRRSRPAERTVAKMVHLLSRVTSATPQPQVIAEVARVAGVARSGVVSVVEDLERFGHIVEFASGIRFKGDPAEAMESLAAHHTAQVEVEESRLAMVTAYAETASCRRRYLLNYLGDDYPGELCLRCDNCLRQASGRGLDHWDEGAQARRVAAGRGGPFVAGQAVRHPQWGHGAVQRVEGEVLVVRFDTVGYRSMHAPTVIARGLLQPG